MSVRLIYVVLILMGLTTVITGQELVAYRIFTAKGKKSDFGKMLKASEKADVILFGEFHNNPIVHWLQFEFTSALVPTKKLILGAEMFETDNQEALNRYLKGEIDQKGLDTLARLWNNYKTDYKPLVEIAKTNNLNFIATNIPRRYASKVFREGFEALATLSEDDKKWIAPLPIPYDPELPGYKNMLTMMGDHTSENFPKAQAIKDATMAHNILTNNKDSHLFIHYNGAYHSDNYEGILWYLKKERPDLKYITISTVSQNDLKKLAKENQMKADFIIVVNENMTTTY